MHSQMRAHTMGAKSNKPSGKIRIYIVVGYIFSSSKVDSWVPFLLSLHLWNSLSLQLCQWDWGLCYEMDQWDKQWNFPVAFGSWWKTWQISTVPSCRGCGSTMCISWQPRRENSGDTSPAGCGCWWYNTGNMVLKDVQSMGYPRLKWVSKLN